MEGRGEPACCAWGRPGARCGLDRSGEEEGGKRWEGRGQGLDHRAVVRVGLFLEE